MPSESRVKSRRKAVERYHSDSEYRARILAQNAKWRATHRDEKNRSNREWQAEKRREQKKTDPEGYAETLRDRNLRKNFGISADEFDRMLIAQNGVCAICRRPETASLNGKPKRLSVDHDHETGRIRGLLCTRHNNGLGMFQDEPALLRAAADYLERSR